jgi:uncharacterized membrane protein YuzA (DUF378 family)
VRGITLTALILAIVGAINWLLVGLFGFDLVATLFADGFGSLSALSRILYVLVGLSGLWLLFTLVPDVSAQRNDTRIGDVPG